MTIDEFMRDIAPKMRPGWVAMDGDKRWFWYSNMPIAIKRLKQWTWNGNVKSYPLLFKIAPVDDWTQSLRKVGNE